MNDWASIYGVVGIGYGKFQQNESAGQSKSDSSDVGIAYGAGMQFNPIENVALDVGYEQRAMAQSTVSGGYAQSDYQGVANKANGFNLKYRYEDGSNPLGWIGSFTYTEKDRTEDGFYNKGQYYGFMT
ncbi:hypothetical protein CRX72_12155 [Pantoea sp. BRM17]|nr:hypothetical protein CRX72_12155 [Pantoea sp. BRM17]